MIFSGWTGQYCESEVDECRSNPCKHGGECTDLSGGYKCKCPKGTSGTPEGRGRVRGRGKELGQVTEKKEWNKKH